MVDCPPFETPRTTVHTSVASREFLLLAITARNQANLEKHLKSAHSNTSCSVCCQEFDTKEDWTRHCDAAHAGNRARYVRYATLVKNLPSRLNSKEIFQIFMLETILILSHIRFIFLFFSVYLSAVLSLLFDYKNAK